MILRASKKVPGGKLVRIDLEVDGGKIARVKISGDFFLHPEDHIFAIEKGPVGLPANSSVEDIYQSFLRQVQEVGDMTLYGVSLQDMAETVFDAFNKDLISHAQAGSRHGAD